MELIQTFFHIVMSIVGVAYLITLVTCWSALKATRDFWSDPSVQDAYTPSESTKEYLSTKENLS